MTEARKKILILFCGGTIAMQKSEETGSLVPAHGPEDLYRFEPGIVEIADIETRLIGNVDSAQMTAVHWKKLVEAIEASYYEYDGFVVTMGTNTLAYTSSALSFALTNIGKPVVVTGAQIPAEVISSDGRNNLVNAIRVATMALGGVFVVFGSKVMLGCRTQKVNEARLDAFSTINDTDFGQIGVSISINKDSNPSHNEPLIVQNDFEEKIVNLIVLPGLSGDFVRDLLEDGAKGLVLAAYGSGDIPYELLPTLEYASEQEVPVLVTTQCREGSTLMGLNDPGMKAVEAGAIQAFDMTLESAVVKLMWLLAQDIPFKRLKEVMYSNLRGEINPQKVKAYLDSELNAKLQLRLSQS